MPTEGQELAARIRAAFKQEKLRARKPLEGGWEVEPTRVVAKRLESVFGIPAVELERYLTYSRQCTHEWDEGACDLCPTTDHLYGG